MRSLSGVLLRQRTTLRVGGPAREFIEADREQDVIEAVRSADAARAVVVVLGGGSNVVFDDRGFDGRIVHIATRGIVSRQAGEFVEVDVAAGEPWDDFVA